MKVVRTPPPLLLLLYMLHVALVLQGCVGALVVSTAAVATKTAIDPRTVGTQVDDRILESRVANALAKDRELKKNTRIVNTVYQGRVLLIGQTPTPDLVDRAKQIVLGVNGVTEVYNEIRRGYPTSLRRISLDSWITIKICSQLLVHDAVKFSNVKVTTENGEVFLQGLVTKAEGSVAAKIASKVDGVKRVTTAFIYLHNKLLHQPVM